MSDTQFPKWLTRDDFRNRTPRLPFSEEQWTALANGANIEGSHATDEEIPGWFILEIEHKDKPWILLAGPTDVYGNTVTVDQINDSHIAPVWLDSKGHFRLGFGEAYDTDDDLLPL